MKTFSFAAVNKSHKLFFCTNNIEMDIDVNIFGRIIFSIPRRNKIEFRYNNGPDSR